MTVLAKKRPKRFSLKSSSTNALFGYVFVLPAFLTLVVLVLYPLLYAVYISFFNTDLARKWHFVAARNYIRLFQNTEFLNSLLLTVLFTVIVVVFHFVIGTWLAILVNKPRKGIKFFRTVLVLPWLFPEVVIALLFQWIMNPVYGILNFTLQSLGVIQKSISWLSDPHMVLASVIFVCIWKGYPLIMINVLAGLQSIPQELYEASLIDGATKWQSFRYITVPSIRPVITTVLILDTIWWFKHFTIIWIMTGGGPGNDTTTISIEIYKQAFQYFNFGKAAAMSVVVFAICFLITVLYRRVLDHDE